MTANQNSSTTPNNSSTNSIVVNGKTWTPAFVAPSVWPFKLSCAETGQEVGFPTAERRNDFVQVWRSVEEHGSARDSLSVRARALEVTMNWNSEVK